MNELERFKENALSHNICDDFASRWDGCQSNKQIFDMGMHVQGVPFICRSIAEKWGMSPEYIADRFRSFINGKYISEQNGYDSEMYCLYDGTITARTTILTVVGCKVTIDIPKNHVCNIYAAESVLRIEGDGECHVYRYGSCLVSPAPSVKCLFETEGQDGD